MTLRSRWLSSQLTKALLPVFTLGCLLTFAGKANAAEPIQLFNGKDLSGWTIHIRHHDKDVDPREDPKGIFQVKDGLLHISGEEFGCLTTEKEYENYKLSLEFKWGEKRYPPRENAKRDSGILVHVVGPEKVWPRSLEYQIQEGDCGDFWMVDGGELTVRGERKTSGRAPKTRDAEKPHGEWNTAEMICDGGKITNILNGVVVNEGTDANPRRGRILLQSEGAEIFFRNIVLTPLEK